MYSSGTTGNPKGIRLTQANLIAHTVNAGTFEFEDDDKNMVAMPLFHVGGSSYAQFGIHAGIPSIMTREVDGAPRWRVRCWPGRPAPSWCPAVLGKVMEMGSDAVKLFNQLRTFVYGASPMPPALLRTAWRRSRTPTSCRCTA